MGEVVVGVAVMGASLVVPVSMIHIRIDRIIMQANIAFIHSHYCDEREASRSAR